VHAQPRSIVSEAQMPGATLPSGHRPTQGRLSQAAAHAPSATVGVGVEAGVGVGVESPHTSAQRQPVSTVMNVQEPLAIVPSEH
jgi:hypothetical protein